MECKRAGLDALPAGGVVLSASASRPCPNAQVAQLVEQRTENPRVGGSIPSLGTNLNHSNPFYLGRLSASSRVVAFACLPEELGDLWFLRIR